MIQLYLITNSVDGKHYIGMTSRGLKKRWSEHVRMSQGEGKGYLHKAIRHYGPDTFSITEIDRSTCPERAGEFESYYISLYDSNQADKGYNLTTGGERRYTLSKECGDRIGEASKKRWQTPGYKESIYTPEYCKRISERQMGVKRLNRRPVSEQARENMSIAAQRNRKTGEEHHNFDRSLNNDEIIRLYEDTHNQTEVARRLGVKNGTINYRLKTLGIDGKKYRQEINKKSASMRGHSNSGQSI